VSFKCATQAWRVCATRHPELMTRVLDDLGTRTGGWPQSWRTCVAPTGGQFHRWRANSPVIGTAGAADASARRRIDERAATTRVSTNFASLRSRIGGCQPCAAAQPAQTIPSRTKGCSWALNGRTWYVPEVRDDLRCVGWATSGQSEGVAENLASSYKSSRRWCRSWSPSSAKPKRPASMPPLTADSAWRYARMLHELGYGYGAARRILCQRIGRCTCVSPSWSERPNKHPPWTGRKKDGRAREYCAESSRMEAYDGDM
jgi:hypothetical protein